MPASCSATPSCSALHFTGENGVVITDRTQVRRLARLFARLWHNGCEYEARPGQEYRLWKLKQAGSWTAEVPAPVGNRSAEVIWTDGTEHYILATIQDIISNAESGLLLASFGLTGLRDHHELLLDPIRSAVTRGVRVKLLLRPRRNLPRHLAEATELAKSGSRSTVTSAPTSRRRSPRERQREHADPVACGAISRFSPRHLRHTH